MKKSLVLCVVFALSFLFMLCVGCETSTPDWPPPDKRTTVKHTLQEVTNAIVISFCEDLKNGTREIKGSPRFSTNNIPGISYTLYRLEGGGWCQKATTTTICATIVNPSETSIAVRCISTVGDTWPFPTTRHPSVERHTLAAIIKTLNNNPSAKPSN